MPVNAENNQKQDQDNQNQQTANPVTGGGVSVGSPQSRTASFSTGAAPTQTGSGRYTNLQKYLGANQGAGSRLASGIGAGIDRKLQPGQQEADTQASKVAEGIQQGQQGLQRGQGYNTQLQDQNFNAQNFVADQNQLQDFTKFRTGQAIDTNAINSQLNTAQTANQSQQLAVKNQLGQVGNEQGRFGLLKQTFGGQNKPYTTGQQRLDQLFLQADGQNNIGQLQNKLNTNVNTLNQNLGGLNSRTADINSLISGQTGLASQLQDRTNQMETGYIDNLQGQVGGVNAARDAERKRYQDFTNQLLQTGQGKETSQALDGQLFDEALLREGEQTFNFFKNPTLTADQFINTNRNANDYKDIANQGNVDYYGALSQLAGINNSKLNSIGELIDPTTGGLNKAAQFKVGDGSLRSGINTAQEDFLKNAMNTTIVGEGRDSGTSGLFGGGSTATSRLEQNLGKYLQNTGYNEGQGSQAQGSAAQAAIYAGSGGLAAGADMLGGLFGAGSISGDLANNLSGLTGSSGGSSAAAQARAQHDLLAQLNNTLKGQGFNNYLTRSGVKNTDDIADKIYSSNNDMLEVGRQFQNRNVNLDDPNQLFGNVSGVYADNYVTDRMGTKNLNTKDADKKAFDSGILGLDPANMSGADREKFYHDNGNVDVDTARTRAQQYQNNLAQARSVMSGQKDLEQSQYNARVGQIGGNKNAALDELKARLGIRDVNIAPELNSGNSPGINLNNFRNGVE